MYDIEFRDQRPPPSRAEDEIPNQREAFAAVYPEILAVESKDFAKLNVSVFGNAIAVVGHLGKMRSLVSEADGVFKDFDGAQFDRLAIYARALMQADVLYGNALKPRLRVEKTIAALREKRELWIDDVRLMGKRGFMRVEFLERLKRANGPQHLNTDVGVLCAAYRQQWKAVQSATTVSENELAEVENLNDILSQALSDRVGAKSSLPKAARERMAAFTLFYRAYDRARKLISFLRWEKKDADKFLPSLFAGRKRKRRGSAESDTPAAPPEARPTATATALPTAPRELPVLEGELVNAQSLRGQDGGSTQARLLSASFAAQPAAPGMPGDTPFETGMNPPPHEPAPSGRARRTKLGRRRKR